MSDDESILFFQSDYNLKLLLIVIIIPWEVPYATICQQTTVNLKVSLLSEQHNVIIDLLILLPIALQPSARLRAAGK